MGRKLEGTGHCGYCRKFLGVSMEDMHCFISALWLTLFWQRLQQSHQGRSTWPQFQLPPLQKGHSSWMGRPFQCERWQVCHSIPPCSKRQHDQSLLVEHGKWTPLSWCLASLITSLFLSLFDRCCLSLANNMPTMKSVVLWLPSVETTSVSPCGPRLANATQLWNPLGKWSTHFIDRGRSHWFLFMLS